MTTAIFNSFGGGGGRVEFVYFIHGLPWALSTHADVATALSAIADPDVQDYREAMFGTAYFTVGATSHCPAWTVPIFDLLDSNIGKQALRYDEGKQLSGGDWSISVAYGEPLTHTWSHRAGNIVGLEGLDVVPNDQYDPTICYAQLSRDFRSTDTHLYFVNDVGDKLNAKIASNIAADTPTYIWIGNQCLAAIADLTDEGDGEWSVEIADEIWKTRRAAHWIQYDDAPNIGMSDAPLGGISGRPATLYAVAMTDDGTILDLTEGPVRFREGIVNPSSTAANGQRRISHHHWKGWLDQAIVPRMPHCHLRGYRLCRQSDSDTLQPPHISLREWDGVDWNTVDIWLCDAGEAVFFETADDLALAVQNKVIALYLSFDLMQLYLVDPSRGIMHESSPVDDRYTRMWGPVPLLLGWGATNGTGLASLIYALRSNHAAVFGDEMAVHAALSSDDGDEDTMPTNTLTCYDIFHKSVNPTKWALFGQAKYFYEFGWNNDAAAEYSISEFWPDMPSMRNFPLPIAADGSYRFYCCFDTPVSLLNLDSTHQIGGKHAWSNDRPMSGKLIIESIDVDENFIDLENSPDYWLDDVVGEDIACVRSIDEDEEIFTRGVWLFWHPAVHDDVDPWEITEQTTITSDDPGKILRGLLGATDDAESIPERYQLHGVPGAFDGGQWNENIDWTGLSILLSSSPLVGASYSLSFHEGEELNWYKLYTGILATHQIAECYEFVDELRGWRIGYRRQTAVSATAASIGGRVIDDSLRTIDDTVTDVTCDTWLYKQINFSSNHDGKNFQLSLTARDDTGRGAIFASSAAELKIEDKITRISPLDEDALAALQVHFGALLRYVSTPQPEQRARCTTDAILRLAVGREALVTHDYARVPYTGALGVERLPVLVTQMSIGIDARTAGVEVSYRYCPGACYGYAPSLLIDVGGTGVSMVLDGTEVTVTGLPTDPANNEFGDPLDGLTDLERFDCLQWNASTDEVEPMDCSCGDYAVIVCDRHVDAYDSVTPGKNIWTGTIGSVDGAAGSCVLTLDNADDFDVNTDKIVNFAQYDLCEDHQRDYLFFADSNGEIGAADIVGRRWV